MAEGSSSTRDLASEQNAAAAGPSSSSLPSSSGGAAAAARACAQCRRAEELADDADEGTSNLKPCIVCKSVLYCSRDCKKAHGKQHKKACAKLAQEYAKTADIKMAPRGAPPKAETHRGGLQKWQFDT